MSANNYFGINNNGNNDEKKEEEDNKNFQFELDSVINDDTMGFRESKKIMLYCYIAFKKIKVNNKDLIDVYNNRKIVFDLSLGQKAKDFIKSITSNYYTGHPILSKNLLLIYFSRRPYGYSVNLFNVINYLYGNSEYDDIDTRLASCLHVMCMLIYFCSDDIQNLYNQRPLEILKPYIKTEAALNEMDEVLNFQISNIRNDFVISSNATTFGEKKLMLLKQMDIFFERTKKNLVMGNILHN